MSGAGLARLRTARAVARERAWLARADTGVDIPVHVRTADGPGRGWSSIWTPPSVTAQSDKELARPNFKGGYGYHPLLAFLDNAGEDPRRDPQAGQRRQLEHRR